MQEYEVTFFEETDFKDNYGNTWCTVGFLGVGEPVKWVLKDPSTVSVGDKVFGEIEIKTSKAGKDYNKFKRAKPDEIPSSAPQTKAEGERGEAITKSMVVKLAFQAFISAEGMLPQEDAHWRQISYMADMLYKTINSVDDTKITETPVVEPVRAPEKKPEGNPALRKGLAKSGHSFGVADNEPPYGQEDLNDVFPEDE